MSVCMLLYTVMHNHLKIYYLQYPSHVLKDWIHWNTPILWSPAGCSHTHQGPTVKICKGNYFAKSCSEQKDAWSRSASILFTLHEIWSLEDSTWVPSKAVFDLTESRFRFTVNPDSCQIFSGFNTPKIVKIG